MYSPDWLLPPMDKLLFFEDSEITGSHILSIAHQLQAGIKGSIHGMNQLFSTNQEQETGWGMLLIDIANAYNSLNRAAMLMHACVLWSRCSCFLCNIYRDGRCLYWKAHQHIYTARNVWHKVILCPCLCMQLGLELWFALLMILDNGHRYYRLYVLDWKLVTSSIFIRWVSAN